MPYVTYLFCEICGPPANLDIDYISTINSYVEDGRPTTTLDDRTIIWDYLFYRCHVCGSVYKYTFMDVEESVRKFLASKSDVHREYINALAEAHPDQETRLSGDFFSKEGAVLRKRLTEMYEK